MNASWITKSWRLITGRNECFFTQKAFSSTTKPQKKSFGGIYAPIPTPFSAAGEIDFEKLKFNLQKWDNSSLHGLLVLGSNGEFTMMTTEEKLKVVDFVCKNVKHKKILVGTGYESTKQAIWMNQEVAKHSNVEGVLVLNPHYYKRAMTDKVLHQFFVDVADKSPLPVLIYNMPANTGINLSSSLVSDLAKHPNICGMKDSSGNLVQISEIIRNTQNDGFSVFAGSASFLLPAMSVGCKGATVALGNCLPESCVALYQLAKSENLKEAKELQLSLLQPNSAILEGTGALKAALDLMGYKGGLPRSPIPLPTADELKKLSQIFDKVKPLEEKYRNQKS